MYEQVASTGIAALQQAAKMLAGVREGSDSLVGYTSAARVEPLLLIDQSLLFNEALPDVQQTLLALFTGYYLQAAALSTNVGQVEVIKTLDKLNPSRDGKATIAGHVLGLENYTDGNEPVDLVSLGMESYCDFSKRLPVPGDVRNRAVVAMEGSSVDKDINAELRQLSNLSIGKMINVTLTDGENKVCVPVSVRLMANSITPKSLIHILSAGSKDVSFSERIYQWRSGEIEFFRDLILCEDLIQAHKQHLKDDKDGIYTSILNRRSNNAVASLVTGNFSVATASNLLIMSSDTRIEAEVALGLRLSDPKGRQKMFEKTYLMILAVIDTDLDRVTFYTRGIPDPMSVSFRDLKAANKGSGPDISDILAAYRLGSSPSA